MLNGMVKNICPKRRRSVNIDELQTTIGYLHGVDIKNMITSAAKRIRLNECAELVTRTSLI
jgi:hypothetical protein